jgi:nucleoside-diphosphate-sugar epimerase
MTPLDPTQRTALVLGLTGGFGRAVAQVLARRGDAVRALVRNPSKVKAEIKTAVPGLTLIPGDALRAEDVAAAAVGASVIVHGVNPPGYARWREDAIPMLANTIAAAEASGARILFPGNVYVFSPESGATVDETTPYTPHTRKGAVRRNMEEMLADAARERGVRSIILRAGDFFGPEDVSSWLSGAVAPKGAATTTVSDLGVPGVGHTWAYMPDLAEAAARLLDRDAELPSFDVYHFGGHWLDPGRGMAEAVQAALAPRRVPIRRFPWWQARLGAIVVPFLREAMEMRWLWEHPLRLDNRKLEARIGREPHTPLPEAVRTTLAINAAVAV